MDREAEISLVRDLEAASEAQVRAEFYGGGGLRPAARIDAK
jgi:hypothetical protein